MKIICTVQQPCALSQQKLAMEMYAKCLCQGCVGYLYGVNEEVQQAMEMRWKAGQAAALLSL